MKQKIRAIIKRPEDEIGVITDMGELEKILLSSN